MDTGLNFQDICFRSRQTILRMLDQRGYNIQAYQNFGPDEIAKLMTKEDALQMELPHKEQADKKALILYRFTRVALASILKNLLDPEGDYTINPETTEVIVLTMEAVKDTFHSVALQAWNQHKLKLQFYEMRRMVNYPLDHVLQPKFERVPQEQHEALLKEFYARSKTQFPMIRFHDDMAGRCLGLLPGDIVKITSASPSAGEYIKYRVCVP